MPKCCKALQNAHVGVSYPSGCNACTCCTTDEVQYMSSRKLAAITWTSLFLPRHKSLQLSNSSEAQWACSSSCVHRLMLLLLAAGKHVHPRPNLPINNESLSLLSNKDTVICTCQPTSALHLCCTSHDFEKEDQKVPCSAGPCARCEIICIDAANGVKSGPEPLLTLARYVKHLF